MAIGKTELIVKEGCRLDDCAFNSVGVADMSEYMVHITTPTATVHKILPPFSDTTGLCWRGEGRGRPSQGFGRADQTVTVVFPSPSMERTFRTDFLSCYVLDFNEVALQISQENRIGLLIHLVVRTSFINWVAYLKCLLIGQSATYLKFDFVLSNTSLYLYWGERT